MQNALHTPLCDLLGCRYPVLQAGMGGVARSGLVAAVSEAGGFGCLGMVRESPELIAREIEAVRVKTSLLFGVNLIPSATDTALFNEELDVCIEAGITTMVYFWDIVPEAIERAKAAGMNVLYQVGSVDDARRAVTAGADAIIAQGVEAGGHVMGNVSSLVLLPQIVKAVDVPVIGSGGFASGASLVAALALGAQGIHCGTSFLATEESFAHDLHKKRVTQASSEQTVHTDAYAINWPKGSPVRVIGNQMTEGLGTQLFGHDPADIKRDRIAEEEGRPIYLWSTDSPLQSMTGELDRLAMFAGQVSGQIDHIETAEMRVRSIIREAREVLVTLTA